MCVTRATRLVTYVDVVSAPPGQVSVNARHELELSSGERVLLLDDRGWASSVDWALMTAAEVEKTTRVVVGPDEPFDDYSWDDMNSDHWASLQQIAQGRGVLIDVAQLRQLLHDVEFSPAVRARLTTERPSPT